MTIRNNGMTVVCLIILFLNLTILQFNTKQTEGADSQERHALIDILTLKFDFPAPTVTKGNLYDSVAMSELPSHGDPGQPVLPFKSSRVLIPQFKEIQDINVIPRTSIELEGTFKVEFGKTPLPISSNTTIEDQPDLEIYTSTDPFPGIAFQSLSEQYLRGYRILLLKLYPVQYFPKTGKLSYFDTMTLNIELAEKRTTHSFLRDLPQDTTLVQSKVDNPDQVKTYQIPVASTQSQTLVNPAYSYSYVIITDRNLKSSFQPLIDWKIQKGVTATAVLVEDILQDPAYNCDGVFGDGLGAQFNDTQAHVRNFIKDAYLNWETEYVLLGGDDEIIPARGMYAYVHSAKGTYIDYNIPCDMYYGCLDGSWDKDNDTVFGEAVYRFGEGENGTAGEEADFFAEVYVGRATVDTSQEAQNFVSKTLTYEQNTGAPYLAKALMVGETLDSSTEAGNAKDLITDIIPQYTTRRLYGRDGTFSASEVVNELNTGVHIVNHEGHANEDYVMKLSNSQVDSLSNTNYFMIYSVGCYSAAFDQATSGAQEAIAEHFVFSAHGAFAYIGNSRYGWYYPGSTSGSGTVFDRSFFRVLNSGIRNAGKTLQNSKEEVVSTYALSMPDRWTYFNLNLLGDPETELVTAIKAPTAHFETRTDSLTPPHVGGLVTLRGSAKQGTALGATFRNYKIEFGQGTWPTNWVTRGISLANDGQVEVTNGILATWDTSQAPFGFCTLRLSVFDLNTLVGEDRSVVYVSTIFQDDFEIGNFSAWTGANISVGETATVVTTLKHHGVYSGRFTSNGGGGTEYAYCYKNIVPSSEVYARGYFYVSQMTLPQDGSRCFFITFNTGSNQLAFAGWRRIGGVVKWTLTTRNGTKYVDVFSSASLVQSRWCCVELHWKGDSVNGLAEMYVDGKRVCFSYGINTAAFGGVNQVQVGLAQIMYCGTTTVYCDCARIATDYIGPEPATSTLTVTSPNGGESWIRGTTHAITWTSTGSVGAYVKIEILKSGVVKATAPSTANDGYASWTIGSTYLGTDYRVRITSTSNPAITDSSDGDFTITAGGTGSLTVTSPNGGESWKRGTQHPITWATSGSVGSYVKIELLKSGVVKGALTTANDGYYLWTIGTSHLGTDYKIRITSTSSPAITDSSDNYFTITT